MRSAIFRASMPNDIIAASPTGRCGRFVNTGSTSPELSECNAAAYFPERVHDYHLIPPWFALFDGCASP
jgi:hypothetical protein